MFHADVLQIFPESGFPVFLQQQVVVIAVVMEDLFQFVCGDGGEMEADIPFQLVEEGMFSAFLVVGVEPDGILTAKQGEKPYQAAADDFFAAGAGEAVLFYQNFQEPGKLRSGVRESGGMGTVPCVRGGTRRCGTVPCVRGWSWGYGTVPCVRGRIRGRGSPYA